MFEAEQSNLMICVYRFTALGSTSWVRQTLVDEDLDAILREHLFSLSLSTQFAKFIEFIYV